MLLATIPAAAVAATTADHAGPSLTGAEGSVTVLPAPSDGVAPEPSLWWTWTAPETGTYRFYTHGSEMDTVLTVYTDGAGETTLVSNDDDGDVATSLVTFTAEAGDVHAIEVVAPSEEPGLVSLAWHRAGPDGTPQPGADARTSVEAGEPGVAGATAPEPGAAAPEQLAAAQIVEDSSSISSTVNTGEKPQSKTWKYAGAWWAVLPTSSGTWVWRHDGSGWSDVYQLSDDTTLRADVKAVGGVVHVLLHGGSSKLVSLQYDSGSRSYRPWSARPGSTPVSLPGSETATIDIDGTGRMWLGYDTESSVQVRYADSPYSSFSGPVTLETGITEDDIAVVTAMSGGVGVMWSDQRSDLFGFRFHANGAAPGTWGGDESPGAAYAASAGSGFADDHINVAAASDGTLYAVVKTSFDDSSHPDLGLLVRRPGGRWDPFYEVSGGGTRGIVQLNESERTLHVIYTAAVNYDDIRVRESSTSRISFGSAETVFSGSFNNPTSTKDRWTGDLMVLAADVGDDVHSALITSDSATPQEPTDPTDPADPTDPVQPSDPTEPTPAPTEQQYGFFLNDAWTSKANHVFQYGRSTDGVYVGDWDGRGGDTIALRRGNVFHVRNSLGGGTADKVITYGRPGDVVLVGDWDGDGVDTLAVRRGNAYHIKNTISGGPADRIVYYGRAGDEVLVGDWDGRRGDSLAVRRGNAYYVKNTIAGGPADLVLTYGRATDEVYVGDWDGDGDDTLGVRRVP
nr:hypothetical protein DA06_22030 [Georgenia sp. SUBG003]